ncbi:MAG: YafY family transcriptional regulator [Deltaproteobacteria bacterium]|nr:YafY family transcriptional regulator [Deltaproteobacteria bacterium]MBW2384037.1 YafY family transcriptional regulator [Deltaproteobacteria bacterium]MBW2698372.1 YafY family transcriptional regulator [Deltaproteobacteria bacterium]
MRGDQLARQWQLIQRLGKSRAGIGLEQLAEELGCVRRTVYRDLDALMYAGFPVVSEKRDGKVYYRFLDGFQLGDVPFTTDEILALAFGADLLRALEGTVFHDSIQSALAKIRAGLGDQLIAFLDGLAESIRVLPGPHKRYADFKDTIQALNEAVLGRRAVRMLYYTGRTGAERERVLDPYRLWYRSGGLYVIGHDHLSGEIRTFAVDRIRTIEPSGEGFEIPAEFDFDAYTAASFGVIAEPAVRVRIHFTPEWATHVRERTWHPSQKLAPLEDGGVELVMEVGGTHELTSWILSFGAGARVVEPEALRDAVATQLAAALDRYPHA